MYSKTFALENYFMHIPEAILDAGEQLLSEQSLEVVPQEDQGYWVMAWGGQEPGEAEVSVGRKNVKAYSCDCAIFQEKKMCPHVAAAMTLILRRIDAIKTEKQKSKPRIQPRIPRLQVKNIVRQLSEEELRSFLMDQALRNPLLAGELKAQYAHKVELPDADQKYFQVIKNYAAALTQGRLNELKFKKLTSYLNNLIQHGEDLCSTKNYREAGFILQGLLTYLSVSISRHRNVNWSDLSAGIHAFAEKILSTIQAPDFRSELLRKLRSVYLENPYIILDAKDNLYRLLYQFSLAERRNIYEDAKLYLGQHPQEELALQVTFALAVREEDEIQIQYLIQHYAHRLSTIRGFLGIMRAENSNLVKKMLLYVMTGDKGIKSRNWAFEQWLREEKDSRLKSEYLIDFIVKEDRVDQLDTLKAESGKRWPENYRELVRRLKEYKRPGTLVSTLVFKGDRTALLALLKEEENIDIILPATPYLYPLEPAFIQKKFENRIRNHLENHVGYQSGEFILSIFNRLFQIDLHDLAENLFTMIIREFPERKHLIKYLREEVV